SRSWRQAWTSSTSRSPPLCLRSASGSSTRSRSCGGRNELDLHRLGRGRRRALRLPVRRPPLAGEILMTANGYLQLGFFIVVLVGLAKPLGAYMARVYEGQPTLLGRAGAPIERLIYRVCGVDPAQEMAWTRYAMSVIWFSVLSVLAVYLIQ